MLFVKTRLEKSPVHGIGLFADQRVAKGSLVYKMSSNLDVDISDADFQKLDVFSQKQIRHYGYFNDGTWHLAFDDIRFCNHADVGNITVDAGAPEYRLVAVRDIEAGEELLQDYGEFEQGRP
ncbi:SET domain-containing protein-lysine N-methyltransferase [Patescibacteria group bacterium]|nr:MAG: SET domain-containing protein-lysine N-methyltransferase [Patescibacteria group bacterium]